MGHVHTGHLSQQHREQLWKELQPQPHLRLHAVITQLEEKHYQTSEAAGLSEDSPGVH